MGTKGNHCRIPFPRMSRALWAFPCLPVEIRSYHYFRHKLQVCRILPGCLGMNRRFPKPTNNDVAPIYVKPPSSGRDRFFQTEHTSWLCTSLSGARALRSRSITGHRNGGRAVSTIHKCGSIHETISWFTAFLWKHLALGHALACTEQKTATGEGI
jgi:hypothetical protein